MIQMVILLTSANLMNNIFKASKNLEAFLLRYVYQPVILYATC